MSAAVAVSAVFAAVALRSPRLRQLLAFWREYPSDVVELTRQLLSSGHAEPTQYAAAWLRSHGLNVTVQSVPPGGRANVIALAPGARIENARVLLFTHLDVVPGGPPQNLTGGDGRLVARGSTDARGIAAAMMITAAKLKDPRLALMLVTAEEVDHAGIKHASTVLPFAPDITLVNGEPTESKIATAQKGALRFRVNANGSACHSGYPHLGKSAIELLIDFLGRLRNTEWPVVDGRETTMNIGKIGGGKAANVVPGDANAYISFRLVTDADRIMDVVQKIAGEFEGIEIVDAKACPPISLYVPPKAGSKWGTTSVSYNTDIVAYRGKYKQAVLFGASTIEVAHTDNEFITIADLRSMPEAYLDIVQEILEFEN